MSQNSIGRANLLLSANASGLNQGLQRGESDIRGWGSRVSQSLASTGSRAAAAANAMNGTFGQTGGLMSRLAPVVTTLQGSMGGLRSTLGSVVGWLSKIGPVGLIAAGAIAGIVVGAIAAAGAIHSLVENMTRLSDVGRQATAIGARTDVYMGLAAAAKRAGVEEGEFGSLLGKMTAKIAAGSSEVGEALQSIGLSVQQLRGQSADQQFLTIADAIAKVPDAGQRAAAAMKLFEEAGIKLLPTLGAGKDGLLNQVKAAKELGLAFSSDQMASIDRARSAVDRVGAALQGMWNKVTVAAAPFVELIATKLAEWLEYANRNFDTFLSAVQTVFKGVAIAGAGAFDTVRFAVGTLAEAIGTIAKSLIDLKATITRTVFDAIPDGVKPPWMKAYVDFNLGVDQSMAAAAESVSQWGRSQQATIGQSVAAVDAWFNTLNQKGAETQQKVAAIGMALPTTGFTTNQGLVKGTKEELNARYKYEFGGSGTSVQDKQLSEQKQTNVLLKKIADTPAAAAVSGLEVIN